MDFEFLKEKLDQIHIFKLCKIDNWNNN